MPTASSATRTSAARRWTKPWTPCSRKWASRCRRRRPNELSRAKMAKGPRAPRRIEHRFCPAALGDLGPRGATYFLSHSTWEDPHMKWIYAAALGGLLLAAPALAQRDPPGGASSPPATAPVSGQQQFKQISGEYEAAMQSFSNEYRTLKTDEEREKLYNAKYPKPSEYAKRLLPLSQADPKGPLARDVYIWIASHDQNQVGNDA